MREFCTRMALKPTRGSRKIGVVEDADDFNEESANSFLKTLEEPPPGSVLLLLATGTDRQLPTILSRCQIVRFAPLRPDDMRAVLKANGVTDPAQLDRLVRMSGGSAGRALALNDEAIAAFRRTLLDGLTAARPDFRALAEAWAHFYEEAGKETAAQRQRVSLVIGLLVEALQTALRMALGADVPDLEPAEAERLRAFAERLGPDRLLELIDRCVAADFHVERRVQLILVVESVLEQFTRHPVTTR
jgi:DNA polymerase-3 subunit delta'